MRQEVTPIACPGPGRRAILSVSRAPVRRNEKEKAAMARCRTLVAAVLLLGGTTIMPHAAAAAPLPPASPAAAQSVQYYAPERPYYRPAPRRRVCWNERVRRHVGYDPWGRPIYRTYTRRVCRTR
jgi:hypothetical protein